MSDVRITLLASLDEDGRVIFAGGWDTNLLEIIDADEVDRIFHDAKAKWFPYALGDEWREIRLVVDEAAVKACLESPVLRARLDALAVSPADTTEGTA